MTIADSNGNGKPGRNGDNQLTLFEPIYDRAGNIIAWVKSDVGDPDNFRMTDRGELDRELDQGQQQ